MRGRLRALQAKTNSNLRRWKFPIRIVRPPEGGFLLLEKLPAR
jgi:hypothetical protein